MRIETIRKLFSDYISEGHSQAELATHINISQPNISKILNGKATSVTLETLEKIETFFEFQIANLNKNNGKERSNNDI